MAWLDGLGEGSAALAAGDPGRAEVAARTALVAVAPGPAAARAELALGMALRRAGRPAEAAAALRRSSAGPLADPVLAALAAIELAEALAAAGEPAAAPPLLADAARTPGALGRRARYREPHALLASGAAAAAARACGRLLAEEPAAPDAPATRLALADALRASGEWPRAIATYRSLWIEHPAEPAGIAAGRALRTWRRAGAPVPLPSFDDRLERAARLSALGLPRRVLRTLERLAPGDAPRDALARADVLRAFALLQLGRRDEAERVARPLEQARDVAPGTRAGAALALARAAARAGRVEEAAARYRALAASAPRSDVPGLTPAQARDLADDAAFLSAWLFFDAGAYARAVPLLRAFTRERPLARRADDARWFTAWSLVHLGRRDEARRALSRLGGSLEPAALYWQARMARTPAVATALYRRTVQAAAPGSWYALLAAGRLADRGEPPAPLTAATPSPIADGPGAGELGDALARAALLLGAGDVEDGLAELRAAASSGHARDRAAAIAQLADAAGDAELPFRVARDHLAPTRRALRWLYPLAFPDRLPASTAQAGVDRYLYLAVMRRESGFRPGARSAAGAVGLVQLLPDTAERLAAVHGVAPRSVRRLEEPAVSIPLGAAYLGLLADRFRDPAVVLAAYNGGPAPAAAWARARPGRPLETWVEDVSYRETRRYVKTVLADAAVYAALWTGAPLRLDGSRPVAAPREGVAF